jgi:hypothetical protein
MKTKTAQVALASLFNGSDSAREWDDWMEDDGDYIRTSEVMEIEFVLLLDEVVVPKQIERLDAAIDTVRSEMLTKIGYLEDTKAKLLAITHEEA